MTLPFLSSAMLAAGNPLSHVLDADGIGPFSINTVSLIVVTVLLIYVMQIVAKSVAVGPESEGSDRYITKSKFGSLIEVTCVYLMDTVIKPQLGKDAAKFTPFLLTIFFFILFNNLFGLIPLLDIQHLIGGLLPGIFSDGKHTAYIGGTATGRIAVTGALALIAFLLWQINGIRSNGIKGWLHHFLGGGPLFLAPIMVPVEIIGMLVKPGALAIRLFANMTAGHVLLAVIIGFTAQAPAALGPLLGAPISLIALVAAVLIMFLEIFVALLQAFIFMFLTTLFIAQMSHHEHDDHAGAEAYDVDHPGEEDLAVPVTA